MTCDLRYLQGPIYRGGNERTKPEKNRIVAFSAGYAAKLNSVGPSRCQKVQVDIFK